MCITGRAPCIRNDAAMSDRSFLPLVSRLRAGVRLTLQGSPANRSLSAIEPVSAPLKGKLKNGDQRPAPKTRPARTEIRKIIDQRLGSARVTRGNVGDSPPRGNKTPETGLPGWGTWIRTKIDRVRVPQCTECAKIDQRNRRQARECGASGASFIFWARPG